MKRSAVVHLVLLGSTVGLHGCGTSESLQQQRYLSREDCLKDWNDPASCTAGPPSGGQGAYYYGPRYYWDPGAGRPVTVSADGTERTAASARISPTGSTSGITSRVGSFARGGFGAIAHAFGGGRGG
jgi:hypothetical protein